jgi:FAD/FMN-containing dehydrogenase
VGLAKRDHLHCSRSEEELALMRRMKRMLDPDNILNPNKIFTADQVSAA